MTAFYQEFTANRTTLADLISILNLIKVNIDPNAGVADIGLNIFKVKKNSVFSPGEISTIQNIVDTAPAISNQLNAQHIIDNMPIFEKAIYLTIIDETNRFRDWITQFKAATAAATSLADLKTRVAALPDFSQVTTQQAIAVVRNKAGTL